MKYIFTIATNIYCNYFENFKNSINNFYPDEDKIVVVFSNQLNEYNNWQIGNTKIEVIDIPNLLYTSILLNKFNFIEWYANNHNFKDNQVIFYFDIDTYFYENSDYIYLDNLINEHNSSVIFSNHPMNLLNKLLNLLFCVHGYIYNPQYKEPILSQAFNDYSFSLHNIINKDCITSFFCGTIQNIKKLNSIYTDYYKECLHIDRVIPQWCDEDIVNYIWLKQLIGEISEQYVYVTDNNLININIENIKDKNMLIFQDNSYISDIPNEISQYFLCNQKYNINQKDQVR